MVNQEEEDALRPYDTGIDPGKSALGMGIANRTTRSCSLHKINLTIWNGEKHEVEPTDYSFVVIAFVKEYTETVFKKSRVVFIERQPPMGCKKIKLLQDLLIQTLRCMFPDLPVVQTSPSASRAWWKMTVKHAPDNTEDQNYKENKKESSRLLGNVLSPDEMARAFDLFSATDRFYVDGIEAMQLCVFGTFKWRGEKDRYDDEVAKHFDRVTMVSTVLGAPRVRPKSTFPQKVDCPHVKRARHK